MGLTAKDDSVDKDEVTAGYAVIDCAESPDLDAKLMAEAEKERELQKYRCHETFENPLDTASWFSHLTLHYLDRLIRLGRKRPLEDRDVWLVPKSHSVEYCAENWEPLWKSSPLMSEFALEAILVKFGLKWFLASGVIFVFFIGCQLLLPYFVQAIIAYIGNGDGGFLEDLNPYATVSFLLLVQILSASCSNTTLTLLMRLSLNMRNALLDAIYRKTMVISTASKQKSSSGEMLTLMSVDTQRVFMSATMIHWTWGGLIILVAGIALLVNFVGVAGFAGVGVMFVLFVFQGFVASFIGKFRLAIVKNTQQRIKLINEALRSVRIIKYYAWENPITQRVEEVRSEEIWCWKKYGYTIMVFVVLLLLTPALIMGATFGTYAALGHELTVTVVFTTMSFINVIHIPLTIMPMIFAQVIQGHVSAKRILTFLKSSEVTPPTPNPEAKLETGGIEIMNANFSWVSPQAANEENNSEDSSDKKKKPKVKKNEAAGKNVPEKTEDSKTPIGGEYISADEEIAVDEEKKEADPTAPFLMDINVKIAPGSLTAIVGPVGSGKSSLISALLGQMWQHSGYLTTRGKLGYVSQEAWIPHGTVKDSILFHSDFDAQRYSAVLNAAQLRVDLANLPGGDETEIGEKGINLSGGQKARLSLARALYKQNTDILLLDDPLSAVDAHVAKKIFEEAIIKRQSGTTCILVLNSHYHFLDRMDQVIIMDSGRIVDSGHPAKLKDAHPSYFAVPTPVESDSEGENEDSDETSRSLGQLVSMKSMKRHKSQLSSVRGKSSLLEGEDKSKDAGLHTEEDRETGAVTANTYLRYFRAAGQLGPLVFLIIFILFVIVQTSITLGDWWLTAWSQLKYGLSGYSDYLGIYYAIMGATVIFTIVQQFAFVTTMLNVSREVHRKAFWAVIRSPVTTFFDVTPLGRILNRFSQDMDQMDALSDTIGQFTSNLLAVIAAVIISCTVQPYIILTFLPVFVIYVYIQNYFRFTSREMKRLESISRSPIYSSFGETITGVGTIRAFGLEQDFINRNREAVNCNSRHLFAFNMLSRWLAYRLDILSALLAFFVCIFAVSFKSSINPGFAGLAVNYCLTFTGLLQWVVRLFIVFENSMTSVERILHLSENPSEAPLEVEASKSLPTSWPEQGVIEFKNVTMRYRPELSLVLKGLNMSVQARQKVGICGRTGAGKSSLMVALYRMVEVESGSISIDGIDISTIGLHDLREKLAIIPQDPVMFTGTVRYNLDPFNRYSDDEIWEAIQRAHLYATISEMPSKLETVIAEGGENLSVGQRQLICIARALLMKTRILIMDEATASVDTNTDVLVQETIREHFADRTVLCIAHRLETIVDSDCIAVIDGGIVKEFAPPATLLADSSSAFCGLAQSLNEDMVSKLRGLLAQSQKHQN